MDTQTFLIEFKVVSITDTEFGLETVWFGYNYNPADLLQTPIEQWGKMAEKWTLAPLRTRGKTARNAFF